MAIEITNLTEEKINLAFLKSVALKTLVTQKSGALKDISLVLVDEAKIKEINNNYRHKNTATDVLSFEGLNEIFICPAFIGKQAEKLKQSFESELSRVLIHGILHLAGYDHEKNEREAKAMSRQEEEILNQLKN